VARFEVENLVQQWYGDASFSGFRLDYSGATGSSSSHPPPFDSPHLAHTHNDEDNEECGEESEDEKRSLLKIYPTLFSAS
jgi:hypothetical protein